MKRLYTLLLLVLLILPSSDTFGQLGKMLKDKAKNFASGDGLNKLRDLTAERLDEARSNFDSTSFSYAISLNDNSGLYDLREKGEGFLKIYSNLGKVEDEKEEREKARDLLDRGEGLYASGYYQMAERLLLASKEKYETHELTDDINYPKVISNLGLLYSTTGRYTAAEEFILQALNQEKESRGEESTGYGASLNNLAVLHKETGRYTEAEASIVQAAAILLDIHGNNSMPFAIAQNNEAMIYQAMGRYDQAEVVLKKAIDISAGLQSSKSGNHQKFISNLALLYQEMGKYDLAETTYKDLIALKERRFGKRHPDYAHVLNNLAALYMEMGKYDQVETLLKEAIGIYERKFGKEHPLYAAAISDLGNFYRFQADFGAAEPLLSETLDIRKKLLGTEHPQYVQSTEDIAILYWKKGEREKAESLYKESLQQSLSFINRYFPPMSEAEKTRYWDKLRPRFERFYAFAAEAPSETHPLLGDVYDYHIATKGLLLNSTNKIKKKILGGDDKELISKYLMWLDQKEKLAKLYSYSREELVEQKINRDSLEKAANATEKELSQRSEIFSEGYQLNNVTYKEVKARLKQSEVAIEVIRFRNYDKTFSGARYLVLALNPTADFPSKVVIDNGDHLEGRYFKYYNNAIHQKITDEYSYPQYWAPIRPLTKEARHLYLSLDGVYNQISLNTLRNPSGNYLIQEYDLTLLANSRDLIGNNKSASQTKSAVLVGFPEYGNGDIPPLPGTKAEVTNIGRLLTSKAYKISTLSGANASEQSFKAIANPKVLHVATHGYFLEDKHLQQGKVFGISSESARDNPLLRAGLLLAGAGSTTGERQNTFESSNNGVLTAYEAMNMSLDNTDLVVLSACETAVGDVKAGEGVYGLQRAFLAAGAKALIMSLWKVDDEATQELMTKFYAGWLKTGNKQQAFKEAQLALKIKYKEPYYWGGFVLVGS
ncbi:CHAT domain-containing tetratricopeptide repeat protein [Fulvivirga imtechensis]|nr:CHAT domain-containing tetratricopeptide repeat protein [Fulvivirga imtechensis]